MARLIQLEAHEPNPHFQDDYRQTFIALSLALKGSPIPFIEASYTCYGIHPDKVWPAILARREAILGPPTVNRSPKKPCATVGRETDDGKVA